jgi:hypothetical protein
LALSTFGLQNILRNYLLARGYFELSMMAKYMNWDQMEVSRSENYSGETISSRRFACHSTTEYTKEILIRGSLNSDRLRGSNIHTIVFLNFILPYRQVSVIA